MAIEVHFEKRIINNHVIREADAKSHRDYIVVTALAAMFLFGLFAYGWQHYQWIQYGYRIEEAQKKKEQLAEVGRQLMLEQRRLRNPQRIDSIARRDLGMVVPAPGQLDYSACGRALGHSGPAGTGSSAAAGCACSETISTRFATMKKREMMKSQRWNEGRRVFVLIGAMALWARAIGARLYFLHVVHSADYRQRAEHQQQRTLDVSPRRGVIYDRNGNELAISIKVDSVFAVPDEIDDPVATAKCAFEDDRRFGKDLRREVRRAAVLCLDQAQAERPVEATAIRKAKTSGHLFPERRQALLSKA